MDITKMNYLYQNEDIKWYIKKDQVTDKAVFSQNACKEGERIMKSKNLLLGLQGENMRKSSNEAVQTLFMLTRMED